MTLKIRFFLIPLNFFQDPRWGLFTEAWETNQCYTTEENDFLLSLTTMDMGVPQSQHFGVLSLSTLC